MTTATKLAAFKRKHAASPSHGDEYAGDRRADGPSALVITELMVTALRTWSRPTISMTKAWREGFSKALLTPKIEARTQTSQNRTAPKAVKKPEYQRLGSRRALEKDHEPALVDTIGDHAAVRPKNEDRQCLQRCDEPPGRCSISSERARATTGQSSASRCRSGRPTARCNRVGSWKP